jgi:oligopeptide/dipeptide ABC transporter ATP-binding protein
MYKMLLEVKNLRTSFFLDNGELKAVDDISFSIEEKQTLAVVGESGCGKTIVALSILNLVSFPGKVIGGQVNFEGTNLLELNNDKLCDIRGRKIGMVFQEPASSLNPVFTIGAQLKETLSRHTQLNKLEISKRAIKLLGDMDFKEPEKWVNAYPHQLSGGMKQRAAIALAMCAQPKLLIADEPTTALDVTVQAEILDLLKFLKEEHEMAMLLISHDLGVVTELADRVMVMYAGKQFENASIERIIKSAKHPYTQGLLRSIMHIDTIGNDFLEVIPGSVPDLLDLPKGCSFHPRCSLTEAICQEHVPKISLHKNNTLCACHLVTNQS